MSKIHQTTKWQKLSKEHKQQRCYWCGKAGEMQSDHVLPVSKWPMAAFWMINLVFSCDSCNQRKGNRLKFSFKTIKLLSIYAMIKLLKYSANGIVVLILIRFIWLDVQYNDSIISNHIKADFIQVYEQLRLLY